MIGVLGETEHRLQLRFAAALEANAGDFTKFDDLFDDVPGIVDVEEADAPALDVIERARRCDRPRLRRRRGWRHRSGSIFLSRRDPGARHLTILDGIMREWYRCSRVERLDSPSAAISR